MRLFRARRLDSGALFDDPASWHVFRQWSKGEIDDEEIVDAHGAELLEALRRELDLQGGSTPTQMHLHAVEDLAAPALSGSSGPPGEEVGLGNSVVEASGPALLNAASAAAVVDEETEGLALGPAGNTEDNGDMAARRLVDTREGRGSAGGGSLGSHASEEAHGISNLAVQNNEVAPSPPSFVQQLDNTLAGTLGGHAHDKTN